MPQLLGVTVHVTDTSGNALTEWGTRYLRHGQKVFTYVKSTTDAPFQITVQPQIPFSYSENDLLDHDTSPPSFEDEMLQEHARQGVFGKENDSKQSIPTASVGRVAKPFLGESIATSPFREESQSRWPDSSTINF